MSSLEKLPMELFNEVSSYLAFFDKKALSMTCKQNHALIGTLLCPDQISWIVHFSHSAATKSVDDPLLLLPSMVLNALEKTSRKLNFDEYWDIDDISLRFGGERTITRRKDTDFPVEAMLLPYFDRAFPQSTIAYFFFQSTHGFVTSAIPILETAFKRTFMYAELNELWRKIVQESRRDMAWLARRIPVSTYLPGQ